MRELLVLEHTPGAGASAFEPVLDDHRAAVAWRRLHVPESVDLPPLDQLAGLIVMGGTMSAVDPAEHPWMPPEIAYLRDAVDRHLPVLGVCLGAQLLGQALGGSVTRRTVPQIGYRPLRTTPDGRVDEVVADWADDAPALFVHEDEVSELPPDATPVLTGSDRIPGWRRGSALAVQFHPEVTIDQLEHWTRMGALDAMLRAADVDPAELLEDAAEHATVAVAHGQRLVERFLRGPVARAMAR